MKKLPYLLLLLLFAMCKTPQTVYNTNPSDKSKKEERNKKEERDIYYTEQTKNDFRAVSEAVQKKFLNDYQAADEQFTILFFTQGFYGEVITVKNNDDVLYKDMVTTDKKTGLAKNMRILNTSETSIYDQATKKTIYIDMEKAAKHKFIYVMKDLSNEDKPYKITYSDKLRPAK